MPLTTALSFRTGEARWGTCFYSTSHKPRVNQKVLHLAWHPPKVSTESSRGDEALPGLSNHKQNKVGSDAGPKNTQNIVST
jgi:hypothetical protein